MGTLPNFRGENKKSLSCHHLVTVIPHAIPHAIPRVIPSVFRVRCPMDPPGKKTL